MATFQDLISGDGGVRSVINDTNAAQYRYSDPDLMGYGNDCLLEIAIRRPELFTVVGEIACTAGTTVQTVATSGALKLLDIYNVKNGRAVTETTRDKLDRFNPLWRTAAAATPSHWVRNPLSALGFFIDAPAPAGQVLIGCWAQAPVKYLITDQVPIPYHTSIKDYITFRAEARDDEHVNSQRALAFFTTFERSLGIAPGGDDGGS